MQPKPVNQSSARPVMRAAASFSLLASLAACASHAPIANSGLTASQEAAVYRSHAKANYAPPGPPGDPWGPYVQEASKRFDVPGVWIREVMHVESGGYQFRASGALTTSPVGAMGLMQLMPETYDELRGRYGLADDAFDPQNNILAGAAYMREMYDAFGTPGFLAAYNAGPARLEDYLTHNRALPDETRRYVYMIGSRIQGTWPENRAPSEQLAVNQLPISIPAGPRWARHTTLLARNERRRHEAKFRYAAAQRRSRNAAPVEVAEAPEPRFSAHGIPQVHMAMATSIHHGGLHFITPAMASESMHGGHDATRVHAATASLGSGHAATYHAHTGSTHAATVHSCVHRAGACK